MIKFHILHWERPSTKVVIVIFSALLVLSSYFIISSYRNYLQNAQVNTLKNLRAISNTLSLQIESNDIEYLDSLFLIGKNKNEISTDSIFNNVQGKLDKAGIINKIEEPIVIIFHDVKNDKFYYISNATDTIFFGDTFLQIPKEFRPKYKEGGVLGPYKDEFGTWLTSLTPIKNKSNLTVGAIEVDLKFDSFISMANEILYKSLLASILIFIFTSIVLLRYVRIVLVFEETSLKIIEEKNNDIIQSINYALRIQTAILPSNDLINKYLRDYFILYKPKDIVAGDFYWMERVGDVVLLAACDCTGHGVPGAMVSVVCHNALNRAVREFGLTHPGSILDKTTEMVIENLSNNEEGIRDGMDISLCSLTYDQLSNGDGPFVKLEWAGANNPLWIVRSSGSTTKEGLNTGFEETKADKQPIGRNEYSKPFTNHTITLNKGDSIYLFSDGYADQFSGDSEQKKLTKRRFKDLILSIQNKSLQEQRKALDEFIVDYGKGVEQVDDILVIGVKV